jgi:hypothetical protein
MKTFDEIWNEYSELVRLIRKKPFSCQADLYWDAAIALRNEISKCVKPSFINIGDKASDLLYRCGSPELLVSGK